MKSPVYLISTAYNPKPVSSNSALIQSIKALDSSVDNIAGKYIITLSLLFNSANSTLSVALHERSFNIDCIHNAKLLIFTVLSKSAVRNVTNGSPNEASSQHHIIE